MIGRYEDAHRELREQLGVYALGHGTPAERAVVGAHVNACSSCRSELIQLASTVSCLARMHPTDWAGRPAPIPGRDEPVLARKKPEEADERRRFGRPRPRVLLVAASLGSAASGYGLCWLV